MTADHTPVFEALIVPHRSLTRKGLVWVGGGFTLLSALLAIRFWICGAWPVMVFTGLEIPILLVLLAINVRRARASELLLLTRDELTIVQTSASGHRQTESLPAGWLRVDLEQTGGISRVMLRSHRTGREVGALLHEPDRVSLFEALREALHKIRNPRFDNPQLRESFVADAASIAVRTDPLT